jgi:hypothetical protein
MASYQALTQKQVEVVERSIHAATWSATKMLAFFRSQPGLILNIGEGQMQHTFTKWEKMNPGQVSGTLQSLPDSHPRLEETTTNLAMLATKIVIPVVYRDAWASNTRVGGGDMLQAVLQQQMYALYKQVDQFLLHGDEMKDPLTNDFGAGEGTFTGLLNGFTTLAAGIGADNNTSAAGDYVDFVVDAKVALKTAGIDHDAYFLLSDTTTAGAAETGNNLYTTYVPTTEKDIILKRTDVIDWIDTPNAQNASSEQFIAMFHPYKTLPGNGGPGEPAFRLIQGYDFKVIPLYGGGVGPNMSYELAVVWSGALEEDTSTAVQHSGALTT